MKNRFYQIHRAIYDSDEIQFKLNNNSHRFHQAIALTMPQLLSLEYKAITRNTTLIDLKK